MAVFLFVFARVLVAVDGAWPNHLAAFWNV